jgi:hypothetical protein
MPKSEKYFMLDLEQVAVACTVWGDLFNRPDCGFVQSGKKRE